MEEQAASKTGFCIFVSSLCEGQIPVEWDEKGNAIVYSTEAEAQRVIAEETIERLSQFLEGRREFDDAMTVEEYVVPVDEMPDGSMTDEDGHFFGKKPI